MFLFTINAYLYIQSYCKEFRSNYEITYMVKILRQNNATNMF